MKAESPANQSVPTPDYSTNSPSSRKQLLSWAAYDWANSAFAVTIISGFFPLFFKQYWSHDTPATTSTFYLGLGNSLASLIIVIAAPVLGALTDLSGLRKRMLVAFASTGILACLGLFFVAKGMWPLAIMFYVIGVIGFSGANVFYDSMLVVVSSPASRHRDSALGYALGYLGGGILFLINVTMTLKPQWFGLADASSAVRWSFISVGVWWAIFSLPLILFVKDKEKIPVSNPQPLSVLVRTALASLYSTLRSVRHHKNIWLFLLSYWLYIDGVITIIKMGVDYGLSIGLPTNSLISALLMVQFIGFPATLIFGRLAEKYGAIQVLWLTLWIYVIATGYAYFMNTSLEFYILAGALGLVQGAVQAISRSLYSQLIPKDQAGEYFGLLNVMGKSAAVIGPLMVGTIAYFTQDSRLGFLSILLLFIAGMLMLRLVKAPTDDVSLR